MNKQTDDKDDELDEFEKLEFTRDLVEIGEIMAELNPEDFEKEFEELRRGLKIDDPEKFRRFLKRDIPWARRVLKKYEQ